MAPAAVRASRALAPYSLHLARRQPASAAPRAVRIIYLRAARPPAPRARRPARRYHLACAICAPDARSPALPRPSDPTRPSTFNPARPRPCPAVGSPAPSPLTRPNPSTF